VWSWTGSNRRHPACKAGALPTELQPRNLVRRKVGGTGWRLRSPAPPAGGRVVGLGGLEPPTSRLSGARSSQLSYRPKAVLRRNCVCVDFPCGSSHLKERNRYSVPQNQTASPMEQRNLDCGADLVDLCSTEVLWHRLCASLRGVQHHPMARSP
jgi:hypothetical protein